MCYARQGEHPPCENGYLHLQTHHSINTNNPLHTQTFIERKEERERETERETKVEGRYLHNIESIIYTTKTSEVLDKHN